MSEIIKVKVSSKEAKKALFQFVEERDIALIDIDSDEIWDYIENGEIQFKDGGGIE